MRINGYITPVLVIFGMTVGGVGAYYGSRVDIEVALAQRPTHTEVQKVYQNLEDRVVRELDQIHQALNYLSEKLDRT